MLYSTWSESDWIFNNLEMFILVYFPVQLVIILFIIQVPCKNST